MMVDTFFRGSDIVFDDAPAPQASTPMFKGGDIVFDDEPPAPAQKNYDTQLAPEEETAYQQWRATLPKELQYEGDYDLRGYWKDPQTKKDAVSGDHFIDKYKKPNHPTFSVESIYATGEDAKKAGRWDGDRFVPASARTSNLLMPGGATVQETQRAAAEAERPTEAQFAQEIATHRTDAEPETAASKPIRYIGDLLLSVGGGFASGLNTISEALYRAAGNKSGVEAARQNKRKIEEDLAPELLDTKGGGAADTALQLGKSIAHVAGEFAPAAIPGMGTAYTAAYIPSSASNRMAEVYETAKDKGLSDAQANTLATGAGAVDALANMLMMGTFKGVWQGVKKDVAEYVKRSFVIDNVNAALKTGLTMGGQSGANAAIDMAANAKPVDMPTVAEATKGGFAEGFLFHVANSGVHHVAHAIDWKAPAETLAARNARRALNDDRGRGLLYNNSPEAAEEIVRARMVGDDISQEALRKLGIPKEVAPTQADRNAVADTLLRDFREWNSWVEDAYAKERRNPIANLEMLASETERARARAGDVRTALDEAGREIGDERIRREVKSERDETEYERARRRRIEADAEAETFREWNDLFRQGKTDMTFEDYKTFRAEEQDALRAKAEEQAAAEARAKAEAERVATERDKTLLGMEAREKRKTDEEIYAEQERMRAEREAAEQAAPEAVAAASQKPKIQVSAPDTPTERDFNWRGHNVVARAVREDGVILGYDFHARNKDGTVGRLIASSDNTDLNAAVGDVANSLSDAFGLPRRGTGGKGTITDPAKLAGVSTAKPVAPAAEPAKASATAPAPATAPTAPKPVEKAPTSASTPPEVQSTPTTETPVETPSRVNYATTTETTPPKGETPPAVAVPDKANAAQKAAFEKLGEGVTVTSAEVGDDGVLRVKYTRTAPDGKTVEFDSAIGTDGATSTSIAGAKPAPVEPAPETKKVDTPATEPPKPEPPATTEPPVEPVEPATAKAKTVNKPTRETHSLAFRNALKIAQELTTSARLPDGSWDVDALVKGLHRNKRPNLYNEDKEWHKYLEGLTDGEAADFRAAMDKALARGAGAPNKKDAERVAEAVEKLLAIPNDGNRSARAIMHGKSFNKKGLTYKELERLHNDETWHENLGLPEAEANALRAEVEHAYEASYFYQKHPGVFNAEYENMSPAKDRAEEIRRLAKSVDALVGAQEAAKKNGNDYFKEKIDTLLEERNKQVAALSAEDKTVFDAAAKEIGEASKKNVSGEEASFDVNKEASQNLTKDGGGTTNKSVRKGVSRDSGGTKGERVFTVESVDGDNVTVVQSNRDGDVVQTRTFSRQALNALAKVEPAWKAIADNPAPGQKIRRQIDDASPEARALRYATDADYADYLKRKGKVDSESMRDAYDRESATAAAQVAKNHVAGAKVKYENRDFNPNTDGGDGVRKSVSGVYTGSAADYANRSRQGGVDDGPSLHYVGTGERSGVYGRGLYGSTERGVADRYADVVSKADAFDKAKKELPRELVDIIRDNGESVDQAIDAVQKEIAELKNAISNPDFQYKKMFEEWIASDESKLSKLMGFRDVAPKKTVYEQTFFTDRAPGDESHLLKWYDAISDANWDRVIAQAEKEGLRDKLKGAWWLRFNGDLEHFITDNGNSCDAIYERLSKLLGSPKAASEFLARAGIDGVKYPVDSYGGKGVKDGDKVGWNYVSFRDDNIRVDHKWADGQLRYLRNAQGRVVGTFNRATNEVTLYRGANAKTVTHELSGHAMRLAAEQAAANGDRRLLDRIERAEREAPKDIVDEIRRKYPDADEQTLKDEIWAALRERHNKAVDAALKTRQGREWYARAWLAMKDAWRSLLTRLGYNRADISKIDSMSNDEFLDFLDEAMAKGKTVAKLAKPTGGKPTMERGETFNELRTRKMSDRYDPWRVLGDELRAKSGGKEIADPYYAMRVRAGHDEADKRRIDSIEREYMDFMRKHHAEITTEDMGAWLRAKDALFRNPDMEKRLGVKDGAGISTDRANEIKNKYIAEGKETVLEKGEKILRQLQQEFGLDQFVESGMLDAKTAKDLRDRNPDYVPQMTDMNEDGEFDRNLPRSLEASAVKRAFGRKTEADNPVGFMFEMARSNAARINKNRVRQEIAKLVRRFPELGRTRAQNQTSAFNYSTGEKAWVDDPYDGEAHNPNLIAFREHGKKTYIELDGKRGELLAQAARDEGIRRAYRPVQATTAALASTATRFSWAFGGRNALKDTADAAAALALDLGWNDAARFLKHQTAGLKKVIPLLAEYNRTGKIAPDKVDTPEGKVLDLMVKKGALIGGMTSEGYQRTMRKIENDQKTFREKYDKAGAVGKGKLVVDAAVKWPLEKIDAFNGVIELLTRYSDFYTRLEATGKIDKLDTLTNDEIKKAVIGAREDLTDFNKWGQWRVMNDIYMFANSTMGSTLRGMKLVKKTLTDAKIDKLAAFVGVGAVGAMLRAAMRGEDDEGDKNMTERDRAENLLTVRVGDRYFRVPMHRGPYSLLMYAGDCLARASMGELSWSDAAKNLTKEAATVASHLSGAGEIDLTQSPKGLLNQATPSLVRPLAELATNRNYADKPIYQTPISSSDTRPRSEMGFANTGEGWKMFARAMNAVGNAIGLGDEGAGTLDNPPEVYRYLAEVVTKNLGRDVANVASTGARAVESVVKRENKMEIEDVPFVGDVIRKVPDNTRRYQDAKASLAKPISNYKEADYKKRIEMAKEIPALATYGYLEKLSGRIDELRHRERGEVRRGRKWVKPDTPVSDKLIEEYTAQRVKLQKEYLDFVERKK